MDRQTKEDTGYTLSHPARGAGPTIERVLLPLPPQSQDSEDRRFEMEVYARFMRHLRQVPNSRMEMKIFSAIQFTADLMDSSDALVAKTLVDLGMRAPRLAFPVSFLDFADRGVMRSSWDSGLPPASIVKLNNHWNRIGEDRFAHTQRDTYTIFSENVYLPV